MMNARLSRRAVLRGAGVTMGLPFLESLAAATSVRGAAPTFCRAVYGHGY